jgi:hypothetical protein
MFMNDSGSVSERGGTLADAPPACHLQASPPRVNLSVVTLD